MKIYLDDDDAENIAVEVLERSLRLLKGIPASERDKDYPKIIKSIKRVIAYYRLPEE